MTPSEWTGRLACAVALLVPALACADPKLELSPARYDFADFAGGGQTTATFDVQITNLDAGVLIAGYDFGLIYDPLVMTFASFSGFDPDGPLGDPDPSRNDLIFDLPQVVNKDYLDLPWDYRDDYGLGAYEGPILGTPYWETPGYYEGSLRFSQVSNLCRDSNDFLNCFFDFDTDLLTLQPHGDGGAYTLFTLTFDVNTTQHKSGTPLAIIYDQEYEDYETFALLDVKLSTPTDPNAELARYPERSNGAVWVPAPATAVLMLAGLIGGATIRRVRRSTTRASV